MKEEERAGELNILEQEHADENQELNVNNPEQLGLGGASGDGGRGRAFTANDAAPL